MNQDSISNIITEFVKNKKTNLIAEVCVMFGHSMETCIHIYIVLEDASPRTKFISRPVVSRLIFLVGFFRE